MIVLSRSRFIGLIALAMAPAAIALAVLLYSVVFTSPASAASAPSYYSGGGSDFERTLGRQLDETNRQLARIADNNELQRTLERKLDETNRQLDQIVSVLERIERKR